jgi:hypothetical protein
MKNIELARGRKIFLAKLFAKSDAFFSYLFFVFKLLLKQINLNNTKLIFSKIIASIRGLVAAIKSRLDHKHHPFFTKKDHDQAKHKGSVSFFLKDISEHKKNLKR